MPHGWLFKTEYMPPSSGNNTIIHPGVFYGEIEKRRCYIAPRDRIKRLWGDVSQYSRNSVFCEKPNNSHLRVKEVTYLLLLCGKAEDEEMKIKCSVKMVFFIARRNKMLLIQDKSHFWTDHKSQMSLNNFNYDITFCWLFLHLIGVWWRRDTTLIH